MAFAVTTDFVNGNAADADEVNVNFEDIEEEINLTTDTATNTLHPFRRDNFTDAGPHTKTGDTNWTTKITKTITPKSANNILIGMKVTMDLKSSDTSFFASSRVTITDGTIIWSSQHEDSTNDPFYTNSVSAGNTITESYVIGNIKDSNQTAGTTPVSKAMKGSATYTLDVDLKINNGSYTTTMENITITLYWMDDAASYSAFS